MIAEMSEKTSETARCLTNADCGPVQMKKLDLLIKDIQREDVTVSCVSIMDSREYRSVRWSAHLGGDRRSDRPYENIYGRLNAVLDRHAWSVSKKTLKSLTADLSALLDELKATRPAWYYRKDIPKDARLVSDAEGVAAIRERINHPAAALFESFFVVAKDDGHEAIYGCKDLVPKDYGEVRRFV